MSTVPNVRKIRVIYDENTCIAAQSCVKTDPKIFGFSDEKQKAVLIGGQSKGNGVWSIDHTLSDTDAKNMIDAASSCPVNSFVVIDLITNQTLVGNKIQTEKMKEVKAQYDDTKEFVLDPKGYFLFRVNYETKEIEAGFCNAKNVVVLKVTGKKPIEIYHTLAKQNLGLRPEHYAYVGRELQKAYTALQLGLEYIQDDELDVNKKHVPKKA